VRSSCGRGRGRWQPFWSGRCASPARAWLRSRLRHSCSRACPARAICRLTMRWEPGSTFSSLPVWRPPRSELQRSQVRHAQDMRAAPDPD